MTRADCLFCSEFKPFGRGVTRPYSTVRGASITTIIINQFSAFCIHNAVWEVHSLSSGELLLMDIRSRGSPYVPGERRRWLVKPIGLYYDFHVPFH
jgi:hypothetical protein